MSYKPVKYQMGGLQIPIIPSQQGPIQFNAIDASPLERAGRTKILLDQQQMDREKHEADMKQREFENMIAEANMQLGVAKTVGGLQYNEGADADQAENLLKESGYYDAVNNLDTKGMVTSYMKVAPQLQRLHGNWAKTQATIADNIEMMKALGKDAVPYLRNLDKAWAGEEALDYDYASHMKTLEEKQALEARKTEVLISSTEAKTESEIYDLEVKKEEKEKAEKIFRAVAKENNLDINTDEGYLKTLQIYASKNAAMTAKDLSVDMRDVLYLYPNLREFSPEKQLELIKAVASSKDPAKSSPLGGTGSGVFNGALYDKGKITGVVTPGRDGVQELIESSRLKSDTEDAAAVIQTTEGPMMRVDKSDSGKYDNAISYLKDKGYNVDSPISEDDRYVYITMDGSAGSVVSDTNPNEDGPRGPASYQAGRELYKMFYGEPPDRKWFPWQKPEPANSSIKGDLPTSSIVPPEGKREPGRSHIANYTGNFLNIKQTASNQPTIDADGGGYRVFFKEDGSIDYKEGWAASVEQVRKYLTGESAHTTDNTTLLEAYKKFAKDGNAENTNRIISALNKTGVTLNTTMKELREMGVTPDELATAMVTVEAPDMLKFIPGYDPIKKISDKYKELTGNR